MRQEIVKRATVSKRWGSSPPVTARRGQRRPRRRLGRGPGRRYGDHHPSRHPRDQGDIPAPGPPEPGTARRRRCLLRRWDHRSTSGGRSARLPCRRRQLRRPSRAWTSPTTTSRSFAPPASPISGSTSWRRGHAVGTTLRDWRRHRRCWSVLNDNAGRRGTSGPPPRRRPTSTTGGPPLTPGSPGHAPVQRQSPARADTRIPRHPLSVRGSATEEAAQDVRRRCPRRTSRRLRSARRR